jgi:DNA-binding transcriptional ArsR family regulator
MDDRVSILDRVFFHPTRFLIIKKLAEANGKQSFVELYTRCNLKNHGTLAAHLRPLERVGYIRCAKSFNGVVPLTTVILTGTGRRAYQSHIAAMTRLMRCPENMEAHA